MESNEMHDKLGLGLLASFNSETDRQRLSEREKELSIYYEQIQQQEKQLHEYEAKIKKELLNREKVHQKELEDRTIFLAEREKKLLEHQIRLDVEREAQQNYFEKQRKNLENESQIRESEYQIRESEYQKAFQDLAQQKIQYNDENRNKIEVTSSGYVSKTLDILERKEKEFLKSSKMWGCIGASSLYLGLLFFVYVTSSTLFFIPNPMSWEFITFALFKGLLAVGLFAALAKYSLIFSNLYMREALKNADRGHAINFGKFYLSIYGAAADWTQIKEAFEHWNIAGSNAFSSSKAEENNLDITINSLEKLSKTIEKFGQILPTIKKDKSPRSSD